MEERWLEKSTAFDRGSGESGHESGGNFGQDKERRRKPNGRALKRAFLTLRFKSKEYRNG